jgi:hypothetical protein
MRRWIPLALVPFALTLASASHALAPGDAERGFREGANHHVGDDSFAAFYGRLPGPRDSEALRMHTHFVHVRRWLADRPPTKPELAARRQEILGYFDEYIAKGATPLNVHVPWRTPVFIDDHGTICAVGYLIAQTAGRPLADRIAREHRYNLLEDIAVAMPEVRQWVESSGLSLEELASIQPGYIPPNYWNERDLTDGPIDSTPIALDVADKSGFWTSRYPTGERLAEGRYGDKRPQGAWRFFHPSGNLAAVGVFEGGVREGRWTFFHDTKHSVRMATGSFVGGVLVDDWRHFDEAGNLVGRSRPVSPAPFAGAGYLLHVLPRADHAENHWVHQADIAGTRHRLDFIADGHEQVYVRDGEEVAYEAQGQRVSRVAGRWESSDCHWGRLQKATARAGDVVTLHGLMWKEPEVCGAGRPLSASRGKHIERLLASVRATGDSASLKDTRDGVAEGISSDLASIVEKPGVETPAPAVVPTRLSDRASR